MKNLCCRSRYQSAPFDSGAADQSPACDFSCVIHLSGRLVAILPLLGEKAAVRTDVLSMQVFA